MTVLESSQLPVHAAGFLLPDGARMPSPTGQRQSAETPKAADAFAAYVALGPGRTLEKLAVQRVGQGLAKNTHSALVQLKKWSAAHGWQERIRAARNQAAADMLETAEEIDADTFLKTSRELNSRADFAQAVPIMDLVKLRESVRKPSTKSQLELTGKDDAPLTIVFRQREDGPQ